MRDNSNYIIEISGQIRSEDLTAFDLPGFQVLHESTDGLAFSVKADQSGLIGLLRQLHSRGIVFEAVRRETHTLPSP